MTDKLWQLCRAAAREAGCLESSSGLFENLLVHDKKVNVSTHFRPIAAPSNTSPLVRSFQSISRDFSIESVFRRMAALKHCLFLDSSAKVTSPTGQHLGQYSFIVADPIEWIELRSDCQDPFDTLRQISKQYCSKSMPGLPPFQGGFAGLFSYDLNRSIENIDTPRFDEFRIPLMAVGLYDVVIAINNQTDELHIVSQGWPADDESSRALRARQRLEYFVDVITSGDYAEEALPPQNRKPLDQMAPHYAAPGPAGLLSNFSKPGYLEAVQKCIDYIYAGDAFQINLAQRLLFPASQTSHKLYRNLRRTNPSPFSAYFDLGDAQIMSASPERYISLRDTKVETRPIKGTRRRTRFPEVDLVKADELKRSEKDLAENMMIVDLMRNDLSRVCRDDSIQVTQLCGLEEYQSVLHLVSAITGTLQDSNDVYDLLQATFPGGSITGAPKVRAMEIIQELEPTARGAYCGSIGYIGMDGSCDQNILIRTVTAKDGWWQIQVGGGIVAQSDPQLEYDETWTKAARILQAFTL